MKVDMNLLKQLREMTQAPFKDCKEALTEAEGDMEKAQSILREKGAAKAAKKSGRETNEGIIKTRKKDDKVIGIKLLCETDFVAKNENFHELAEKLLDKLEEVDVSEEKEMNINDLSEDFVKEMDPIIQEYIIQIGENVSVYDVFLEKGNNYVYTHPGNKVISVVSYECEGQGCEDKAKEVALQVAAMNPSYKDIEDVPEEEKEKRKQQFRNEMEGSGKPEDIIEKIVDGKLTKSLSEDVLMEQPSIRDETKKVRDIVGEGFKLTSFKRFSI